MAIDYSERRVQAYTIVFGLTVLFSIIELAISAWLTARFDARLDYFSIAERDGTHFILFASLWTSVLFITFFLGMFGMMARSRGDKVIRAITSNGFHVSFLLLTWIFWTAGAASITSVLGGGLNCSQTIFAYCGQLNAMEAFSWLIWILVTLATVAVLIQAINSTRRGEGFWGSVF